jgi:DNA-binding MarR family transcriptional regulator
MLKINYCMARLIQTCPASDDECRALAEALRPVFGRFTLLLRAGTAHLPVTASQTSALSLLLDGPKRMHDMTRGVGVTGPAMTVLVDRLERQGWVRRHPDPDDRRVVRVELTGEGRAALEQVLEARTRSLAHYLSSLSREERESIAAALPALAHLADEPNPGSVRVTSHDSTAGR